MKYGATLQPAVTVSPRQRRPALFHPEHDCGARAPHELGRRDARVWERFYRQHVIQLYLVQRFLWSEPVRPELHEARRLLGAGRVGIHDRRTAATGLLPAIPISPLRDNA